MVILRGKEILPKLRDIASIEARAYPEWMRYFDEDASLEEIEDYFEEDIHKGILIFDRSTRPNGRVVEFYCLLLEHDEYYLSEHEEDINDCIEIADLAGSLVGNLSEFFEVLRDLCGDKTVVADLRESTSYRLLTYLVRKGKVRILSQKEWFWGEERMLEVVMKFV